MSGGRVIQSKSANLTHDATTSSGSYALVHADVSISITTGARSLRIAAQIACNGVGSSAGVAAIFVDGVQKSCGMHPNGGNYATISMLDKVSVSAGSHTVEIRWKTFGTSLTCNAATNPDFYAASIVVEEVT